MINVIIPMAGRGERFLKEGFEIPKPLIEFNGKTMIEYAIESLNIKGNFIFIIANYSDESLNTRLRSILSKYSNKIISVDYTTDGPASSALLAKDYVNNENPLIITNCDQIMDWNSDDFLSKSIDSDLDGVVVTYNSNTQKNSYIKLKENGLAEKLAEKEVISNYSLNGIHYWKKGKYFVESAEKMISKNIRCSGEFYISLTYNEMIDDNFKVGIYHIDEIHHNPVGTPEDLNSYLKKIGNGYKKIQKL